MNRSNGFPVGVAVLALATLLVSSATALGAADEAPDNRDAEPRHRIDLGLQWFDAAEGSIRTGSLAYSWVPLDHHAFAATVPFVGADLSQTGGSGIGDLQLQYSYVPSTRLSASSWVPNTLGLGCGLILPTGDPTKGIGGDRWIVIPTLGWVFVVNERFSILPTLQYFHSFGEGPEADEFRSADLELASIYVFRSEFWINYTASLFRDLEPVGDTNLDHFLTFGKQFTRTFGSSLTLGSIERARIQDPDISRDSDQFAEITFHFVLPW